jgi:hypothetical protein
MHCCFTSLVAHCIIYPGCVTVCVPTLMSVPPPPGTIMQVAKQAYEPRAPPRADSLVGRNPRQPRLPTNVSGRPCTSWSHDEAYMRTGAWFGTGPGNTWTHTDLGGSDVVHRLDNYVQDYVSGRGSGGTGTVLSYRKLKTGRRNLIPGVMLWWCSDHEKCVGLNFMQEAESPRTFVETWLTRFPDAEEFLADNTCLSEQYALNRDPLKCKPVRFFIDEMHYRGHKNCCPSYSTNNYKHISNSPLAEQKNSMLTGLRTQVAFMSQPVALWFMRYIIYRFNKLTDATKNGLVFWRGSRQEHAR